MRKRMQRGFTLMELMVVIVIVAILAAVAVPLYMNYVNDAKRTEGKGAIGAIMTAEQKYFQDNGGTNYATGDQLTAGKFVDLTDVQSNWSFNITPNGSTGFTVKATGTGGAGAPPTSMWVQLVYTRGGTPAVQWSDDSNPGP